MKFSDELNSRVKKEWKDSYIQYSKLNIFLKSKVANNWIDKYEYEFINIIEVELKKVYKFVQTGIDTLDQRIEKCNTQLNRQKNRFSIPSSFDNVTDTLAEIITDVDELVKFHELNLAGFRRIIEKHDTYTPHNLHAFFYEKMLETYPLERQRFDILMVRISRMYDLCRHQDSPKYFNRSSVYIKESIVTEPESIKETYWIHPDYVTEVKAIILLNMPIHEFDRNKPYEAPDSAVSSIYYDNDAFDYYRARINRVNGVQGLRMRWYGKGYDANKEIQIDRKTCYTKLSRDTNTRIVLKEHQINNFIEGKYTDEYMQQELDSSGCIDKSATRKKYEIAKGLQESILGRRLKPICRAFCNRTTFQSPKNHSLRINLDSNLAFIREDHMDGVTRRQKNKRGLNWRRSDIDIDYPFRNVAETDIVRFPYAVLETKTEIRVDKETPEWLNVLLDSHLVYKAPQFSKYVYGTSCLLEDHVSESPTWLPKVYNDIRKMPSPSVGLSRTKSSKALFNGHRMQSLSIMKRSQQLGQSTPLGKSKDDRKSLHSAQKEIIPEIPMADNNNAKSESILGTPVLGTENFKRERYNPQVAITIEEPDILHTTENPKKYCAFSSQFLPKYVSEKNFQDPPSPPEKESNEAPNKNVKKKLDAKAFFSNERTFMSWLQFCAILFTISLNLLNHGDGVTRMVGSLFIGVSSVVSLYALARFHLRAFQLRTGRKTLRIDDVYGPGVLCVLLVAALAINFYLRIPLLFSTGGSNRP